MGLQQDDVFHVSKDIVSHMLTIGTTRKKSFFTNRAPLEGSVYEKKILRECLETQMSKLIDQKEEKRMENEKVRLQKVKDAYWEATNDNISEFYAIYDSCTEFLKVKISDKQAKAIFNLLPSQIIGSGIQ